MGRWPWRPSTYSFVCDLYKHSGTSLCHIAWEVFEIWASKTLTKSFPPPSIYFLVIYDKICGFLFLLFFICDLNKQSGTSLFHILWTYYEISALKTLTRSHIFVKYYKVILLRFCSYYLEHLNYLNYRNYLNYLNYVNFLKYLNYFNYLNYPNHLNNLNYFNYHMNMKMNMSMDMIMNMNINMNTNMNMNMNMIALIQNNFYSE